MKSVLIFLLGVAVGVAGHATFSAHARPALAAWVDLLARRSDAAVAAVPATTGLPGPDRRVAARFPVERTLTNRSGVSLAARLLARNEHEVLLVRLSDGAAFRYAIDALSEEDQRFVRALPATALPAAGAAGGAGPSAVSAQELQLLKQRAEVEHQIEILGLELAKVDDPNPRQPRDEVERQLKACRNLLLSIDQELKQLHFR